MKENMKREETKGKDKGDRGRRKGIRKKKGIRGDNRR